MAAMPSATGRPAVHEGEFDDTEGIPHRRPMRESAAGTYDRSLPLAPVRTGGLPNGGAEGRHRVVAEADRAVLGSDAVLHVPDRAALLTDACTAVPFASPPGAPAGRRRDPCRGPARSDAVAAAAAPLRTATGRGGPTAVTCGRITGFPYPYGRRGAFGVGSGQRAESRVCSAGAMPDPARGIRLIADEAQTGVGRTGALRAVGPGGVAPDVMVMPKAIGGSLPPAAVVHRDALGVRQPGSPAGSRHGDGPATAAGVVPLGCVGPNGPAEQALPPGARMPGRPRSPAAALTRGLRSLPGRGPFRPDATPGRRGVLHAGPRLAAAVPTQPHRRHARSRPGPRRRRPCRGDGGPGVTPRPPARARAGAHRTPTLHGAKR